MKVDGHEIKQKDNYFKDIFNKYYPALCIFAGRLINDKNAAEDLVQDVFVKVWKSDVELENEKALQAYLYVSTKNTCFTYLKKSTNLDFLDSNSNNLPAEKDVLNEILRQETYRLLEESINKLGEQSQKVVRLTLSGYTNNEIAQELSISINTIKTLKLRAYKKIRNLFGYQALTILSTQFFDIFS